MASGRRRERGAECARWLGARTTAAGGATWPQTGNGPTLRHSSTVLRRCTTRHAREARRRRRMALVHAIAVAHAEPAPDRPRPRRVVLDRLVVLSGTREHEVQLADVETAVFECWQ